MLVDYADYLFYNFTNVFNFVLFLKVWISFAQFEASQDGGGIAIARAVYVEGWVSLLAFLFEN